MLLLLFFVTLLSLSVEGRELSTTTDFDGTWHIDLGTSQSSERMLELMGVSYLKRSTAARLDIFEAYVLTQQSFYIHRVAASVFHDSEETLVFNVSATTDDALVGRITSKARYANREVTITSVLENGSQAVSVRSILADNTNRLKILYSYKPLDAPMIYCTRYYNRLV